VTKGELLDACNAATEAGLDRVCLVVPTRRAPRGPRVRLDQTSRSACPMGEVACYHPDPPRVVAWFDALDVVAWMIARGMVP